MQAKFADGGSVFSSNQLLLLPQKLKFALKVVKIDTKIIISLTGHDKMTPNPLSLDPPRRLLNEDHVG
jgi:hypothetical protein